MKRSRKMVEEHWEKFIHGENEALSQIYEPLFQPLLLLAVKYVKNPETARDITSELFASLLETDPPTRLSKWSQIRDIKSFLSTIIKCRTIDHIRTQQSRLRLLRKNETLQHQLTSDKTTELEHLKMCINALSIEEKQLMELHLAGFKNEEIAEQKNYTEKTIRNKLSASRKKLIYLWKNLILAVLCQL